MLQGATPPTAPVTTDPSHPHRLVTTRNITQIITRTLSLIRGHEETRVTLTQPQWPRGPAANTRTIVTGVIEVRNSRELEQAGSSGNIVTIGGVITNIGRCQEVTMGRRGQSSVSLSLATRQWSQVCNNTWLHWYYINDMTWGVKMTSSVPFPLFFTRHRYIFR